MERNIKQQILNSVDVEKLLRKFSVYEIAHCFSVTQDYVTKTARLQKIIVGEITAEDEMKIGRRGAWMLSVERKFIKQTEINNNYKSDELK